jgi:hypothetical protein
MSRRPASVRKPERARAEPPIAEAPEAPPPGAGPGVGVTGGLPTEEGSWSPPGGPPRVAAAKEAAAAAEPIGETERRR